MHSKFLEKEICALIPARGGSKSIPKKNLINILNKPLIGWTIEIAKASKKIDRVIVTTDDSKIAEISKSFGAEVPFLRPTELAEDHSKDIEYHLHAMEWLEENESYHPFAFVNLRPTTPLRDSVVIDNAIEKFLQNHNIDSLRSVQLAEQTPFKMWAINKDNYLEQITYLKGIKEPYNEPRQKLPKIYWQNGYVDIVKSDVIKNKKSTTGEKILPFFIEDPSIDLDYPEDIKKAEIQLRNFLSRKSMKTIEEKHKYIDRFPS